MSEFRTTREQIEELHDLVHLFYNAVYKRWSVENSAEHAEMMARNAAIDMNSLVMMELRTMAVDEVAQMIRDKTEQVYIAAQRIVDARH